MHNTRVPARTAADPQGFEHLLELHLEWLAVRNYSAHTAINRRQHVGYFLTWAEQRGLSRPSEITKPILERYQRYLFHYRKDNGDPLEFRTQKNYLVDVRSWFKWLSRHNHILYNPASELDLPRLEHKLPKHILTASEAEQVLGMARVDLPVGLRDRAMLEVLYSTGIRRMELIALSIYDIDFERGTLTVRQGKGKKDRVVPISDRALSFVERYLHETRPGLLVGNGAGDVLFLNQLGQPIRPASATLLVREYVEAADIGKRGGCHLFRHTMATLMHENGCDIRHIQVILGHVKLDTTMIYTQVAIRQLREIHTATHPGARAQRPPREEPGIPVDW
jgi:integrase/recombinase XerD